jgi:surface antigen
MPSFKDRHDQAISMPGRAEEPILIPGLVTQLSPVEQLSFPASAPALQAPETPLPVIVAPPLAGGISGSESVRESAESGQLPELQTALLPLVAPGVAAGSTRPPLVIRGEARKALKPQSGEAKLPRKRWPVHAAVLGIVALVIAVTLLTVLPESSMGASSKGGFFQAIMNLLPSNSGNGSTLDLNAMRAATATAISQSGVGYDPGPSGSQPITGSTSGDPFPIGQCTYWADYRYHQLTGYWVPWGGNAYQWAAGAQAYGWHVSTQPHVPSIIVLMPGVQGANIIYGHVAVVESITSDGGVYTSNMNWYANGGGWDIVSYYTFYPGSGVYFVWK